MTDQLPAAAAAVDLRGRRRRVGHRSPRPRRRPSTAASPSPELDEHQVLGYDLAHAASAVEGAKVMLDYARARRGRVAARARVHRRRDRRSRRASCSDARRCGASTPSLLAAALPFVEAHRSPEFLESVAATPRDVGHRAQPPPRRLPARGRDVPPLRRGQDPSGRRARAPHQRRHPRGGHQRPRRDRRLRPLGARGVRRLRRAAARPTTSAWSSPPRSCRGARSASAVR